VRREAEPERSEWGEAIASRDWEAAHRLLADADSTGSLNGHELEQLAETSRWTRRYEEMIASLERACEAFERSGDRTDAGRVAVMLAIEYFQRNELALAGGSLGRATELLGEQGDSRAAGMILFCRIDLLLQEGDAAAAETVAIEMAEMAKRLDDHDLEALAMMGRGRARQLAGGFKEGAALLDQAAAGALAGDLELWTSGYVICANINACRHRYDVQTASEWSDAAVRWCRRQSIGYFPGLCRLHRGESLNLRGDYEAAIVEVAAAIEDLRAGMPRFATNGVHELGEIKRRQGDLEPAEACFDEAIELGGDAIPGLVLLRLDQGRAGVALALARDRLGGPGDTRLSAGRAQVLPAAIRAAIAAGDLDYAREALVELGELATACDTAALRAEHETAAGRLEVASGDAAAAIPRFHEARRLWGEISAPYEGAVARIELARVRFELGQREAAENDAEAALRAFERIGARFEAARARRSIEAFRGGASRSGVTMLFTDIVGSTRLVEALGDEPWEALLAWHDRALRGCLEDSGGREIKHEGDGLFAAFDDPDAALGCACEIQRRLRRHQVEHGYAPSVRIGIHADEVNDRGNDLTGRGVHIAARVMAAADGGEVLTTTTTLRAASRGYAVAIERPLEAKGLAEPLQVASIDWSGAGR
jgi:class 3 adenylate cyclase